MGGKSEGNKKMINVPIRMEIKDNDQLSSETSNNKQYSSQNKKVKHSTESKYSCWHKVRQF